MLAIAENVILRFGFGYLDIHAFSFTFHAIAAALSCNCVMTRGEHLLRGCCTPLQTRPVMLLSRGSTGILEALLAPHGHMLVLHDFVGVLQKEGPGQAG